MLIVVAIDRLDDELGGIITIIKMHHYAQGQKYGHLASAIPEAKYRLVISDPEWNHTVPVDPVPMLPQRHSLREHRQHCANNSTTHTRW
jgi:hypothetical protein